MKSDELKVAAERGNFVNLMWDVVQTLKSPG